MPAGKGWKNPGGFPIKDPGTGKAASSQYCCTCGPPIARNCACLKTTPGLTGGQLRGTTEEGLLLDFLDENDYDFTHDKPFELILFIKDGVLGEETVPGCYCPGPEFLDDDGACSLVCGEDNTLTAFFQCVQGDVCYACTSQGPEPAYPHLPNIPFGKRHGDPCTYNDITGLGSVPAYCQDISGGMPVPIPGGEGGACCRFGDAYTMQPFPNSSFCHWVYDPRVRCLIPYDNLDHLLKTNPPSCLNAGGTVFEAWVDRSIYGTLGTGFGPPTIRWFFWLRMNTFHPGTPWETQFNVSRNYLYASEGLTFDSNGCALSGGSHILTKFHEWVIPSNFAGARPIEWCIPPLTLELLAHGSLSE